jgi:DNA-directed RNA polymerase specialized sigma24 family protein
MKDKFSISELKERQPRAIERLYLKNFPSTIKFITDNHGSMDEARQVFHDGIFVLLEELNDDQQNNPVEDVGLLLYSIVRILWNQVLDTKRMDKASVVHAQNFVELDEERILARINSVKGIEAQFKLLPEPGRTILRDHYAHKISLMEIAQRMGFSEELSAEKHKLKALKHLIESGI